MDDRTEVVILCGLAAGAAARLADRLAAGPGVALVQHGPGRGRVWRRIRHAGVDERTLLPRRTGCMRATVHEDLHHRVDALARRPDVRTVVVHLPPALEPDQVCRELHRGLGRAGPSGDVARIVGIVTVLDDRSWLDAATGRAELREVGLATSAADDRALARVAVGQVELADVIVHAVPMADARSAPQLAAVLDRLCPTAVRCGMSADVLAMLRALGPNARRGVPADVQDPLTQGEPPLEPAAGVSLTRYEARRPFHPERLPDALGFLLRGVVRTRGRLWLASRPDEVLWLESAGGALEMRAAGRWLAADPSGRWAGATPARRARAAVDWDEVYGDRAQELLVLAHAATPMSIVRALDEALLTDREVARAGDWPGCPRPVPIPPPGRGQPAGDHR